MIVTTADLAELERAIALHSMLLHDLILTRPNLLLPCGFDEVRFQWHDVPLLSEDGERPARWRLPWFRQTATGTWYCLAPWLKFWEDGEVKLQLGQVEGDGGPRLSLGPVEAEGSMLIRPVEVVDACRRALTDARAFGAVVLPNIWLSPYQHPRIEMVDSARDILAALRTGHTEVSELTWPQLEDIVAELLRARGLKVTCTPRSADGGRDIIARGELIPGEPSVLAVEVKHKGVVRLDDVRSRLHANKEFPALLFVTSGRFSAGVIREKNRSENFLRLALKDGVALRQWIDDDHKRDFSEE